MPESTAKKVQNARPERLTCAEVTTVRPLNLADFCGDCPLKMGVLTEAVRASAGLTMVAGLLAS